jgi:hypothetical protein
MRNKANPGFPMNRAPLCGTQGSAQDAPKGFLETGAPTLDGGFATGYTVPNVGRFFRLFDTAIEFSSLSLRVT